MMTQLKEYNDPKFDAAVTAKVREYFTDHSQQPQRYAGKQPTTNNKKALRIK
jgi:hypothetical protein